MHCPNCGKELMEGEVCTCTAEQGTTVLDEKTPVYEPPVQEQPVQPQYQPPVQEQYQPNYCQPPVAPAPMPVVQMPARTDYPEGYKIKKKYVAVILAAALGSLGIHDFYLGNSTKGLIKVLIATVGSLLLVGPIVAYVWAIVDTVLLLTEKTDRDANGFKIQTFEEALVAERIRAEKAAKENE